MPFKSKARCSGGSYTLYAAVANPGRKVRSISAILSAIVIVMLLGCSTDPAKQAPSRSDVEQRMNGYNASGSIELSVDIGRTGTKCFFPSLGEKNEEPMDVGYTPEKDLPTVVAVKAGLVSVTPAGKDWWDVSLTEKGKTFFQNEYGVQQFHQSGYGCDEYDVTLLIARASVVDVSAPKIHEDTPGSLVYDYKVTSKWRITDLGKALQSDSDIYRQLSAEQRQKLEDAINPPPDLHQGPKFALPVPHESENHPYSVTATYKKEDGKMILERVRNE